MTMTMTTSATTESAADAPGQSYARLAREFYDPVYYFIARQLNSREDAADLTQQVFLRGFQSFDRFDPSREFAPWIYTIARRVLADHFRSRKQTAEPVTDTIADPDPDPGSVADQQDAADRIWDLAAGLKHTQHQVLLLHYKENFTLRETAKIMGISLTHAKVLLFRARKALKQRLETNPIEGGMDS